MKQSTFLPKKQSTTGRLRTTKIEKLLIVLSDGKWHSTKELVRRVGHSFAVAKFKAMHYGYFIEKRRHPFRTWQWQYRLEE